MASQLLAHNPKFSSSLVTRGELARLPEPVPHGPNHTPIPHGELVRTIDVEMTRRGYHEARSSFALSKKGAAIFGVIDFEPAATSPGRTMSLGFRSSNDRSLALKMVAGARVLVCDNLVLSGEMIALHRLHTTGLDLADAVANGFDRFLLHSQSLDRHIEHMAETELSGDAARSLAFTVFADGVLPLRLLGSVNRFYFRQPATEDARGGTLWALHNAFTRAMQDLPPTRQFGATVALGRYFGLSERRQADLPLTMD